MTNSSVKVYIYDLSKGLARTLSMGFLGKQIDGVWHTGVVAYGQEIFYGGEGISSCHPGGTILGQPDEVTDLGTTEIPVEVFMDYLQELAKTSFRPEKYHLFDHNCNTFSDEIANFLTGKNIPSKITSLPQDVLSSPFGAMLKPFVDAMSVSPEGGHTLFPQQPAAAAVTAPSSQSLPDQAGTSQKTQSTHAQSSQQNTSATPNMATFRNTEVLTDYCKCKEEISRVLPNNDNKLMSEMHNFLSSENCKFSPSRVHIQLLVRLARGQSQTPSPQLESIAARLLQLACLHQDVCAFITHDADATYLQMLQHFDSLSTPAQQCAVVKSLCNLCSCLSENRAVDGWQTGDMGFQAWQLATQTCASCLLSQNHELNRAGAALAANITTKSVHEDDALELGSALLQLCTQTLDKDTANHCLQALQICMKKNDQVSELANVMGVDMKKLEHTARQS